MDNERFMAAAEKMTEGFVSPVEAHRQVPKNLFQAGRQVGAGCLPVPCRNKGLTVFD